MSLKIYLAEDTMESRYKEQQARRLVSLNVVLYLWWLALGHDDCMSGQLSVHVVQYNEISLFLPPSTAVYLGKLRSSFFQTIVL